MKKVYIEGLGLVDEHFSGVGQYILGIIRGIDEQIEIKKNHGEATPVVRVIIPYDTVKKFKKFKFKHIGYKTIPFSLRYASGLNHRNKFPPLDLLCGPGFYIFTRFAAMPLLFSKYAVVVFDLSFELYSQFSDEANAKFLSPRTKSAVAGAVKTITISQNAKREIVDFYKLSESSVVVATPAADQRHFYRRSKEEINKVKQKYGIEGDYLLSLSNLEPRKNLDGLVDAYCALPEEVISSTKLLLVGVNGWKTEKLFQKIIGKVRDGYNIIRPSHYIDDEDKPAILSGAKMLVYPSHYEGFGMPPLEALACGTPVVCANNSSLPEVVADVALQIDSKDTNAINSAILTVLTDKSISKRTLVDGPTQAENFSWRKSAETYYELIMENT
jgi:glycosyltransferase involved in cell wall biosynthesis